MNGKKILSFDYGIIEDAYIYCLESGLQIPTSNVMISFLGNRVTNNFENNENKIDIVTDPFGVSELQYMPKEEWFQLFVETNLFFHHKGHLVNQPIFDVW